MSISVSPPHNRIAVLFTNSTTLIDCVVLFVSACAIRFFWINQAPLWSDELFSVFWSQLEPSFILGQGAHVETNPPVYYLLLHNWIQMAGSTALAVRLPSVFFSAATVLVIYAIGRIVLDRTTAQLAGLFAVLQPAAVLFAQEARPYALTGLLDGLALLAVAGYARAAGSQRQRWLWLALFVLAAIAAFLVHYTSLLFIASVFAVIGLGLLTTRPFPVRQALTWVAAGMVIVLGNAKPFTTAMSLTDSANISWIKPLAPAALRSFVMDLLTHPEIVYNALSISACAALLLVIAAALMRFRFDRVRFGVLVLIPAVFGLLVVGASALRPILLARVGVWLTIPLCLLLAWAVTVQPNRWRRITAACVTLLVLLGSLGHYFWLYEKEDWRKAAQLIADQPSCGGPILFIGSQGVGLVYYGPNLARRPFYAVLMSPRDRQTAEYLLAERVMSPHILDAQEVGGFVSAHPGTAIVMRSIFLDVAPASLKTLVAEASFHEVLGGKLMLSCF